MREQLAYVIITAHITAAASLYVGIVSSIAQARIAAAAIEAISRQPAASGTVTNTLFVSLAMAETNGIYGLLVAIIMLFANPLIETFVRFIA